MSILKRASTITTTNDPRPNKPFMPSYVALLPTAFTSEPQGQKWYKNCNKGPPTKGLLRYRQVAQRHIAYQDGSCRTSCVTATMYSKIILTEQSRRVYYAHVANRGLDACVQRRFLQERTGYSRIYPEIRAPSVQLYLNPST